jgi:hypothetical protein
VDRQRLVVGTSLVVVLLGALLLCFTEGGVFNPVIPWKSAQPWPYGGAGAYRPDLTYIDLTRSGPLAGLLAVLTGAGGLVYAYARRAP